MGSCMSLACKQAGTCVHSVIMASGRILLLFCFIITLLSFIASAKRPARSVLGGTDRVEEYDTAYPTITSQGKYVHSDFIDEDELTVAFYADGQQFTLELKQNKLIFGKNFKHIVQGENGEVKEYTNPVNCYYQGTVKGHSSWSAVINVCNGIRGSFGRLASRNESYYIEPSDNRVDGWHIVYRPSELSDSHFIGKCGTAMDEEAPHSVADIPSFSRDLGGKTMEGLKVKRQSSQQNLYLELYVVTDTAAYTTRGGAPGLGSLLMDVVDAVNVMDEFYQTLHTKVRIALVELITWTNDDQFAITTDSSATLGRWRTYYTNKIHSLPASPDAGMLFIGGSFDNNVLGLSPRGAMCSATNAGVARLRIANPVSTATTAAHQLGHMFGLFHDQDISSCSCEDTECIMTAIISIVPQKWSTCSQRELTRYVTENNYGELCLDDEPVFFNSQNNIPFLCGNGIKEPGESCDCGPADTCSDPCCNAATCELATGAVCTSDEACCQSCQYREPGVLCRRAANICDIPEYCPGTSGQCTENKFIRNGLDCTNAGEMGYCYDGVCRTHNLQCQTLFGADSSRAPDGAYSYNEQGECYGKCGRQGTTQSFLPCAIQNILCGNIQCTDAGRTSAAIPYEAHVAVITFGGFRFKSTCIYQYTPELIDPGYVWDGVRCGDQKVCINQVCASVNTSFANCVNSQNGIECSGNGVCAHDGTCSCFPPWSGANCSTQGPVAAAPSSLNLEVVSSTVIRVTWTAPPNADRLPLTYLISYRSEFGSGMEEASTQPVELTGLHPFAEYTVSVQARPRNTGERYSVNITGNTTTRSAAPSSPPRSVLIPEGLKTHNSLTCTWQLPAEPDRNGIIPSYFIIVTRVSGEDHQSVGNFTKGVDYPSFDAPTHLRYTVTSLSPQTLYSIRIAAVTSGGTGVFSDSLARRTNHDLYVSMLTIQVDSDTSSTISWTAPEGVVVSSYKIYYSTYLIGTFMSKTTSADSATSQQLSSLTPETPIEVSVIPVTAQGPGGSVSRIFFTREGVPTVAVKNVTVMRINSVSLRVSWTPLSLHEARGWPLYTVLVESTAGRTTRATLTRNTNDSTVDVGGLDPSTSYSVRVQVGTSAGTNAALISDPDIDECSLENGGCIGDCNNTEGSYHCTCTSGFELGPDNRTCQDIDECSLGNGGCIGGCNNTEGSYHCACTGGFELAQDNRTCQDIDECSLENGGCSGGCTNTEGSYHCTCISGFELAQDNRTCQDIDECSLENGGCIGSCNNTEGSYHCTCTGGFELARDNRTCQDIDECSLENGGCSGGCNNTEGSYHCTCTSGFELGPDNRACQVVAAPFPTDPPPGDGNTAVIAAVVVVIILVIIAIAITVVVLAVVCSCRTKASGSDLKLNAVEMTQCPAYENVDKAYEDVSHVQEHQQHYEPGNKENDE